ncbi:MAG TPA: AMP-binding protein [Aldersonia sp.]
MTIPETTTNVTTLSQRLEERARTTPDHIALREKVLGVWHQITWRDYDQERRFAAHALADLGVGVGDRVGVLAENRPEWLFVDLGAVSLRAITVGFYPTSPAAEVEHLLTDSGARVLVAEDQEQVDKALAVWDRCPDLEWVVYLDPRGLADYDHPKLISDAEFRGRGRTHLDAEPGLLAERAEQARPDDIATLVYTSGTTGPPKGAMLSAANIDFAIDHLIHSEALISPPPSERDASLSYLPLCHVAERLLTTWSNIASGIVVHFAESFDTVAADLAEVQPDILLAVPRIWEKMQATVAIRSATATPVKRLTYRFGSRLADHISARRIAHGGDHTTSTRVLYAIGYPLLFRALRAKLGLRKVRTALSGTAPISPDVLRFFLGIGVPIHEAYGMTENTGVATSMRRHRMILGTVGEVADGIELRLDPDTGEVLTRHPGNFVGYWNNPEATAATLTDDGWLRTGDVGAWVGGTHLEIVGRIKDILITAGGKNVSPAAIENQLKASPFVKEAIVVGDRRPYLVALLGIEFDSVADWASHKGIQYTTYRDLSAKPEVLELMRTTVLDANERFARVEQVRKFRMLPKELDHEDGELTATRKIKRGALAERFTDLIDDMYADAAAHPGGDLRGVAP